LRFLRVSGNRCGTCSECHTAIVLKRFANAILINYYRPPIAPPAGR
jgi:hypothetical protein